VCGSCVVPDPHHLEILRRGPQAWNAWREQNPSILPLLTDARLTLSERQLGRINGGPVHLQSACLQDAFLRFAALSEADLEASDLTSADLVHARLDRANLRGANLNNAILDHADFAGANLSNANLSGASLDHAQNLTQAQIGESLGDELTILPSHLKAPESWLKTKDRNHTTSLTSDRSPKNSTATSDTAEGEEAVGIIASLSTGDSVVDETCGPGVGAVPAANHVEILRRGPRAWNDWRAENPSTLPLLVKVTLTLSERQLGPINGGPINLASACMREAFLRFAALSQADLEAADLSQADLVHARLDRANLTATNLSNAILDHADFAEARLFRADLRGASLVDARNLTQEQINDSIGNASTILPSHLKAPESWLQTNESRRSLLGPAPLGNLAPKGFNFLVSPKRVSVAWKAGLTGCGVALVVSGFIWLPTFWLYPQASREESVQTGAPKPIQSATSEVKHQASPSTSPTVATSESTLEGSSPSVAAEPTVSSDSAETMRSGEQSQSALDSESQHGEVSRHDSAPETAPSPLAPEFVPNEAAAGAPAVGIEEPAAVVVAAPNATAPELPGGPVTAQVFPGELPPTGLAANPHANNLLPESQIAAALRLGLPDGGLVASTPSNALSNEPVRATLAPLPPSSVATTLAHTEEIPPMPTRKPLVQKSQATLQKGEPDSRPSPRGRAKAPTLADKGRVADQRPEPVTGSNAAADVLAGGL
jgi:uncharacterized protein YjbI with pentapeptide repeats